MSEIQFKLFIHGKLLDDRAGLPAVFLLYGEDLLVEQACDRILECLLGDLDRQLHCELVEGAVEETAEVIEKLNTYGLLASLKVVILKDSSLFYPKENEKKLAAAMAERYSQGSKLAAARRLADICAMTGTDPAELDSGRKLPSCLAGFSRDMLAELAQICRSRGLRGGPAENWAARLEKAISRGFPEQHYLIITTDTVDKRRSLYKTIAAKGLVVDCSVARGSRAADQQEQQAVLRDNMQQLLTEAKKRAAPGVFEELWQRCGFEPRRFVKDLEKVIDYVGSKDVIQAADVARVVNRSRVDPIFEFTNAVADRDAARAVFYLHSLLDAGVHPLQILAAMVNQVRKLLIARTFLDSLPQGKWDPKMNYPRFKQVIWPDVLEYDKLTQGRGVSRKNASDLFLASNPRSTYPVYQTLRRAGGFEKAELVDAMVLLNLADIQLKSSSRRPALVLENVLLKICAQQGRGK